VSGGPLSGVKVVDLTTVVVGPICTRTLADYGAEVIKVEAPGGDLLRTMAQGSRNPGMSGKFINFNRNKRSIVLDIKKPDGLAALHRLIEKADVFVSNVRPEALTRAGLDHASLAKKNPKLIHCSILAFGRGGRYYNRPAYDPIVQSLSGVAGTLERATGEPRFVPMVVADKTVGLIAVQMIAMALYRKARTGEGCSIQIPMFENMVKFVLEEHMYLKTFDPPLGETGDPRLLDPLGKPIPTRDGWICISANTNDQAFSFFAAIGQPQLKDDPRFCSVQARFANVKAYFEVRMAALKDKTTAEWLTIFDAADVPAMPYHTLDSVLEDPHLQDIGFFQMKEHPTEGRTRNMRLPNQWSCGVREGWSPAPKLGEQSVDILREAGLSETDIQRMIDNGATLDGRRKT
jgi:crotonobetainyl-CoA:carnitine CoA-transferase CaiB-like acyl-CoA transferase